MTTDDSFLDKHTFLGDGQPDTLDQRLARELPDHGDGEVPFERQPDAVGELVADPHDGEDENEEQDVLAKEAGPAREDAPAEQAAMHVMELEDGPDEDYSAFVSDVENEGDEEGEDDDEEEGEVVLGGFDDDGDGEADRPFIGRDDNADEFVYDSEWDDDRIDGEN